MPNISKLEKYLINIVKSYKKILGISLINALEFQVLSSIKLYTRHCQSDLFYDFHLPNQQYTQFSHAQTATLPHPITTLHKKQ